MKLSDDKKTATMMYGEILQAKSEAVITLEDGTIHTVKPGDNAIVGFDGFLHQFSKDIAQPIGESVTFDGYSSVGLAQFLTMYLDINMDIGNKLAEVNVDIDYFVDMLRSGLVRIGFNDDMIPLEEDDETEE